MSDETEFVARAIKDALSKRMWGLYDYSNYHGEHPPHVVRNEQTRASVFSSHDKTEARREYDRRCDLEPALAAIAAVREWDAKEDVRAYERRIAEVTARTRHNFRHRTNGF